MSLPTMTSDALAAAAACALAASLAGCAARGEVVAAAPAPARVLVKLVRPSEDSGAIAAEAARVAGVPVTYAAAASPAWHALALQCDSGPRCDAAMARLRAAGAIYQSVEVDGRKTRAGS